MSNLELNFRHASFCKSFGHTAMRNFSPVIIFHRFQHASILLSPLSLKAPLISPCYSVCQAPPEPLSPNLILLFCYIKQWFSIYLLIVLVCYCCHNKIPQLGWLRQEKLIFSQFWMLEVQDQGANRVGLPPWLADVTFSLCLYMVFSL